MKGKNKIFGRYILPFSAMAGLGLLAGGLMGHMKYNVSRPISFPLANGNRVLADGNLYTVTNPVGKPVQHFNKTGVGVDYTDSTNRQHRITEKGYCTQNENGDYANFVSFGNSSDSTIYWVKKEFEDIQKQENVGRAKRKELGGRL